MLGEANIIPYLAKILLNPMGLQMAQASMMPGQTMQPNPMAAMGLPPGAAPGVGLALQGEPVGLLPPRMLMGKPEAPQSLRRGEPTGLPVRSTLVAG